MCVIYQLQCLAGAHKSCGILNYISDDRIDLNRSCGSSSLL
jgi:hypothetical protein